MKPFPARALLLVGILLVPAAIPSAAEGQAVRPVSRQVISANPFGLLLEFFNAEYERATSATVSVGTGGSFMNMDDDTYLNWDAFWRYYPQGRALDGWAFGAKVGVTSVDGGTYPGFGFDVNRSWILGVNDNFYVGVGFGLKRLLGVDEAAFDTRFIPTFRIINVGFAF
ncbi:MAG: hypothetical protein ACYC6F_17155 [Longimicrobiales bacterium]